MVAIELVGRTVVAIRSRHGGQHGRRCYENGLPRLPGQLRRRPALPPPLPISEALPGRNFPPDFEQLWGNSITTRQPGQLPSEVPVPLPHMPYVHSETSDVSTATVASLSTLDDERRTKHFRKHTSDITVLHPNTFTIRLAPRWLQLASMSNRLPHTPSHGVSRFASRPANAYPWASVGRSPAAEPKRGNSMGILVEHVTALGALAGRGCSGGDHRPGVRLSFSTHCGPR